MKNKLKKKYNEILIKYFGYKELKREQQKIIYNIVEKKKDVLAVLATGFGKSVCYQIPFLLTQKCVIVISPLISLIQDQMKQLKELNIPTCSFSDSSWKNSIKGDILKGNYKIIYMTPESCIINTDFIEELYEENGITCFAIDESHCVSQWSDKSFRPEYGELNILREIAPEIPILALTATASHKIQTDIIKTLDMIDPYKITSSFDRPNLYIEVDRKTNDIELDLKHILMEHKNESTIIYTKTRKMTTQVSDSIGEFGIKSLPYHAGLDTNDRKEIQRKFMNNEIKVIVATIAFGMGINHKNIRLVIQYGCSSSLEAYYQEIGRAGRDGNTSKCYMFYSSKDFRLNRYFLKDLVDEDKKKYREKEIVKLEKFVYSTECRRKLVLGHFGEEHSGDCKNCDNCNSKEKMKSYDFTMYAVMLFNIMKKLNNTYGSQQYILILRGSKSKKINKNMMIMSEYNKGKGKSEKWWKELIRLFIANSYIYEESITNGFGSRLKMAELAYDFLNRQSRLKLNVKNDFLKL